MRIDNGSADWRAHAHVLPFGSHKWLKERYSDIETSPGLSFLAEPYRDRIFHCGSGDHSDHGDGRHPDGAVADSRRAGRVRGIRGARAGARLNEDRGLQLAQDGLERAADLVVRK